MCLGIPGRIIDIRDDEGLPMGTIDFAGVRREVCLAYVRDEVEPGDYALVHVGSRYVEDQVTEMVDVHDVGKEIPFRRGLRLGRGQTNQIYGSGAEFFEGDAVSQMGGGRRKDITPVEGSADVRHLVSRIGEADRFV